MDIYQAIGLLLLAVAVFLFIYGFVGMLKDKGHRIRGILIGITSITLVPIIAAAFFSLSPTLKEQARKTREAVEKGGFDTTHEYNAAIEVGALTAAQYRQYIKDVKAVEEKAKRDAAEKLQKAKFAELQHCKKEIQCWEDKYSLEATYACEKLIPKLAQYDHKWTDGMLDVKMSHFKWRDPTKGTVTFIGDKIKFQNGFGAWQHMTYQCDYDPIAKIVLDIRVNAGRL